MFQLFAKSEIHHVCVSCFLLCLLCCSSSGTCFNPHYIHYFETDLKHLITQQSQACTSKKGWKRSKWGQQSLMWMGLSSLKDLISLIMFFAFPETSVHRQTHSCFLTQHEAMHQLADPQVSGKLIFLPFILSNKTSTCTLQTSQTRCFILKDFWCRRKTSFVLDPC